MSPEFLEKHDKKITRIFEILPGLLTWLTILSPIWLGFLYPRAVVYILTFLTMYWCYMAFMNTLGLVVGYPKHKKEMATDWWVKCQELNFDELLEKDTLPPSLSEVKHFILVPCVEEPYGVLKDNFDSILKQTFPTESITLVYALEERGASQTRKNLDKIVGPYKDKFYDIKFFVHPAGIPGEAIGVGGANRTWAAKHAVVEMKEVGVNLRNFIFSSLDCDHIPDPQYISRLTHLYLTTEKRDNHFYATAVHLFNNNLWRVPTMMRIEANFVTLGILSSRSIPRGLSSLTHDTFAAYSCSLQTLLDADFWDVQLGVDDTVFFWRAFFARDGDFKLAGHYIPYSADAVEGRNYWDSHKSLYKQLLRWGWGVLVVPLSVKGFLKNKKVSVWKKLLWTYNHFKTRVVMINMVFLLTFGFALLTLANPDVKQSSFAYSLPDTMSLVLTVTLIFLAPPFYYRNKLAPPKPKEWPWWKKILVDFEGVLVIVNLLTFSFFPFVDAHTRMMFGKKMKDLYHTPKFRKNA
ncbi:hypothetical protein ACFL13_01800 [Patescibacteria group bacterium]